MLRMKITWSEPIDHNYSIPTFHCDCGEITEGFQICLKCNPQTYEVIGMTNKEQILKMLEGRIETMQSLAIECIEMIYNAGYNEGIEHAAKYGIDAETIRKLKK